jgi:uncharacterized protein (TIGR03083 family)
VTSPVHAYAAAADSVAGLVALIPETAWAGPGLGEWDLRALVGHTSRSLVTVLEYLDRPVPDEALFSAAEYCALSRSMVATMGAGVLQRGQDAGRALGDRPADTFRDLAARAGAAAAAADPELVVTTIGGGMRVRNYLPTRTFELAVHGLDIAAATGLPLTLPPEVLTAAAELAAAVAVQVGEGATVLRALSGRTPLPPGFSVT